MVFFFFLRSNVLFSIITQDGGTPTHGALWIYGFLFPPTSDIEHVNNQFVLKSAGNRGNVRRFGRSHRDAFRLRSVKWELDDILTSLHVKFFQTRTLKCGFTSFIHEGIEKKIMFFLIREAFHNYINRDELWHIYNTWKLLLFSSYHLNWVI